MTTKPEGPAQEPEAVCCFNCPYMVSPGHVCTNCGKFNPLPATPAPSQPAGARETGLKNAQGWWDSQYPARSEGQYPTVPHALNDYARQQTAAKDAEAETFRCQLRDALKLQPNVMWFGAGLLTAASAVVAERDSLREANARLAANLDAALKAGKDGQK